MASKHIQTKGVIAILCITFLQVGALFCLNDVIFPVVKEQFNLNFTQTTYIQLIFYIVYIPFPLLIEQLVRLKGYVYNFKLALILCMVGTLGFSFIQWYPYYAVILSSLFVLSIGLVFMNTAVMPYITLLGSARNAQFRANLVQVFSRLGYAATPLAANYAIYNPIFGHLSAPYVLIGLAFAAIVLCVTIISLPEPNVPTFGSISIHKQLLQTKKHPHLYFGVLAMFFYLGSEAGIASFLMNYLMHKDVMGFSNTEASLYLTYYNIASTVMGFAGLYLIQQFAAHKVLATFGCGLITLLAFCILGHTGYEALALVGAGAFLSLMFPTIYGLAIRDLGSLSSFGAALVSMAICGGAFFPVIQGIIADNMSLRACYAIPALCTIYVVYYALFLSQLPSKASN